MTRTADRPDRVGLLANAASTVALCLLLNGVIFAFAGEQIRRLDAGTIGPPGWFIGVVWTLLFAGMGAARWFLLRAGALMGPNQWERARADRALLWLHVLLGLCASYVFYAILPDSPALALGGNIVTLIAALWVSRLAWPVERRAALLSLAVGAWLAVATTFTIIGGGI